MKNLCIKTLLCCTLFALSAQAMDNAHFFRAPFFFGEPRLAEPSLLTFDIGVMGGATSKSRDACGSCTDLLSLYGPQNIHLIGSGVPGKDLTNEDDLALTLLERTVGRDGFGFLKYSGHFSIAEAMIAITKNVNRGLFFQLFMPIRHIRLHNVCYSDCSPCDCECPNQSDPNWQLVLDRYASILERYGILATGYTKSGLGDMTLLAGWACNYEGFPKIDYLDFTARVGVLLPTGKKKKTINAFDIALGYNGHVGIPLALDCSMGAFEWFTVGAHAGVIAFFERKYEMRMKTACCQSGFIKLAQGCAKEKLGTIWDLGVFVKADHVGKGLSLLCGYTHQRQARSTLTPDCSTSFDPSVVNSDQMLMPWEMGTLHFMMDWDFSKEQKRLGERFGIFYNRQITGKRVFETSTGGGSLGFDVSFTF
jgi:hypothetical protein